MERFCRINFQPSIPMGEDGKRITGSQKHIDLSRKAATEGMVLLKNENDLLPIAHGKKIAVPTQHHPWCMHDDNKVVNLFRYDIYRQKFIEVYGNYLGKHWNEIM